MGFFGSNYEKNETQKLAVGMDIRKVYYLLGPPDERENHATGFTMIWKKSDLMGVFGKGFHSKTIRVDFQNDAVAGWTEDETGSL